MSRKSILIIEDNPVNMELASDLLEAAGFTTIQADNAEDGIRLAQKELPDVVLMDIALPGMDGLTATSILRQNVQTASIPIIALTAHAMRGDEDKALAVGCVGYITKPINTRSFVRLVADFCAQGQKSAVAAPTPTLAADTSTVVPLTLQPTQGPEEEEMQTILLPPLPVGPDETIVIAPPTRSRAPETRLVEPIALEPVAIEPAVARTAPPIPNFVPPPTPPAAVPPPAVMEKDVERVEPLFVQTASRTAVPQAPEEASPYLLIPRRGRGGRGSRRETIGLVPEVSSARILVVDDDELNREMITAQLRILGYEPTVVEDGFAALETVDDTFDLVLLDYMMPGMDGCEVCRSIREEKHLADLPVVMVTALSNREDQLRAVQMGANDWITKPVDRNELAVRVKSQLKFKAAQDALKKHQRDLEATVRARTAELRKALEQVTKEQDRTQEAYLDTMHRLALAAEFRDGFMAAAHIRCVGNYCAAIARGMGMPDNVAEVLLHASPLHDIGMLGVPEHIIHKAENRTPDEEAIYRDHTMLGARLLSGSRSELLRAAEVIALSHHEKWDGSGFPQGRSGEGIPLYGRICAVADTFDTITSYKGGEWQATNDEAKEVLMAGRGTEFDPTVIDAFFKQWDEIEMFQKRYRRTEAPPEDLFQRKLVA